MRDGFMPYKSMWYMISDTRRSVITSKSANVSVYIHTQTHTHSDAHRHTYRQTTKSNWLSLQVSRYSKLSCPAVYMYTNIYATCVFLHNFLYLTEGETMWPISMKFSSYAVPRMAVSFRKWLPDSCIA